MKKVRISAVSYLNTLPFIYGINNAGIDTDFTLSLDIPAECARKLIENEADISLVPVGALPSLPSYEIISEYCIGAHGKVRTVLLLSNSSLENIRTIYLDGHSRTSVRLVQVLANKLWNISPEWKPLDSLSPDQIPIDAGVVLIGDKTFYGRTYFNHCFDLGEEWFKLTNLPFVFAAWVSQKHIPESFVNELNKAFLWGLNHKPEAVDSIHNPIISKEDLLSYLQYDISYHLDDDKRKAMNLFLSYI